ncbi:MAG: CGNR zinc finger domain-containing protein [Thermoanaerobaculia bacterium]
MTRRAPAAPRYAVEAPVSSFASVKRLSLALTFQAAVYPVDVRESRVASTCARKVHDPPRTEPSTGKAATTVERSPAVGFQRMFLGSLRPSGLSDEIERRRILLIPGTFDSREKTAKHRPRFLLARAAAHFLASADPSRIRRCGGANCILFFYDATRSATRRWCSMAGCGNRMKAALHYQRSRLP